MKWSNAIIPIVITIFDIYGFHLEVEGSTAAPQCSRRLYGRYGTGIIASYNYPFNYRNYLECTYAINLEHIDDISEKELCFVFYRFELQRCGESTLPYDYLRLKAGNLNYYYCNNGEKYIGSDFHESRKNVWTTEFCFPGIKEYQLEFYSDYSHTERGFYAEYYINSKPNVTGSDVPCAPDYWPCFSRQCIPNYLKCDGVYDCADMSDEMYAHAKCPTGTFGQSLWACDFNSRNSCELEGLGSGWRIESESPHAGRGPSSDHTQGNKIDGAYVRTDFTYDEDINKLTLTNATIVVPNTEDYCLSFWYHMHGPEPGRLEVWYGNYIQMVWSREGSYNDTWHHGEYFIKAFSANTPQEILFHAIRGGDIRTMIAIDDISIMKGSCLGEDVSCSFEVDTCGWEVENISPEPDKPTWKRQKGQGSSYGPFGDASYDADGNYLMYYQERQPTTESEYFVTSPVIISSHDDPVCLSYAYFLNGSSDGVVKLLVTMEMSSGRLVKDVDYRLDYSTQTKWIRKTTGNISDRESFRIKIRVHFPSNQHTVLGMDEIAVLQGGCNDFRFGMCQSDEFRCTNGECISMDKVCDSYLDCSDHSDEDQEACCTKAACNSNEFCCSNGKCIPEILYCDTYNDCEDWSDENGCKAINECDNPDFWCDVTDRCINSGYICNGNNDCGDFSDEANCDSSFPPVAVAGIAITIICIIIFLMSSVGKFAYQNKYKLPCFTGNSENEDSSDDEENAQVYLTPITYEPPPGYYRTMNRPELYPRPPPRESTSEEAETNENRISTISSTVHEQNPVQQASYGAPPAYDAIIRGQYIETTNTSNTEVDRIRKEMNQRSQNPAYRSDSNYSMVSDNSIDVTNLPDDNSLETTVDASASMPGGGFMDITGPVMNSSAYSNESYVHTDEWENMHSSRQIGTHNPVSSQTIDETNSYPDESNPIPSADSSGSSNHNRTAQFDSHVYENPIDLNEDRSTTDGVIV